MHAVREHASALTCRRRSPVSVLCALMRKPVQFLHHAAIDYAVLASQDFPHQLVAQSVGQSSNRTSGKYFELLGAWRCLNFNIFKHARVWIRIEQATKPLYWFDSQV